MTAPVYDSAMPLTPSGNPLLSNMGPASYADRANVPDLTVEGEPKIVPMRSAPSYFIEPRDPDPRGMTVIGMDDAAAGVVTDLWVDRAEPQLRYLEVAVSANGATVLVPITAARVHRRRGVVKVRAILASQFADVPTTASPDRVTLREEDRIMAYYAGGHLFATEARSEPLL